MKHTHKKNKRYGRHPSYWTCFFFPAAITARVAHLRIPSAARRARRAAWLKMPSMSRAAMPQRRVVLTLALVSFKGEKRRNASTLNFFSRVKKSSYETQNIMEGTSSSGLLSHRCFVFCNRRISPVRACVGTCARDAFPFSLKTLEGDVSVMLQ
ncbi:Hypothetical protein, putative [Bodo saltans]|uniref:Uncharacterized protein n=1 Tax=Bodo saltans TaxID=75058 RepID=A0A0S4IRZ3_BODSA|nr:Hypothetical protein, putative [Bodo saltans]|eukprot:CUG04406.1 Hypothetical protein, putative [Bodo saltans]